MGHFGGIPHGIQHRDLVTFCHAGSPYLVPCPSNPVGKLPEWPLLYAAQRGLSSIPQGPGQVGETGASVQVCKLMGRPGIVASVIAPSIWILRHIFADNNAFAIALWHNSACIAAA